MQQGVSYMAKSPSKLVSLIDVNVPDESLIRFMFSSLRYDKEVVWLLDSYLADIWKLVHIQCVIEVQCEELFGFMKFKYKQDQQAAWVHMNNIMNIAWFFLWFVEDS